MSLRKLIISAFATTLLATLPILAMAAPSVHNRDVIVTEYSSGYSSASGSVEDALDRNQHIGCGFSSGVDGSDLTCSASRSGLRTSCELDFSPEEAGRFQRYGDVLTSINRSSYISFVANSRGECTSISVTNGSRYLNSASTTPRTSGSVVVVFNDYPRSLVGSGSGIVGGARNDPHGSYISCTNTVHARGEFDSIRCVAKDGPYQDTIMCETSRSSTEVYLRAFMNMRQLIGQIYEGSHVNFHKNSRGECDEITIRSYIYNLR